ncbi:hypothetical protein OE88DRAFT_1620030 [Heliocybe sulcata]|uniref:Uncharacterized protein n=1 Tax=Heliocybe sulcata TaxID=5364 RepID=A0A5C3NGL7_9AGAM|nr:hypothetical protein OE88DRAFT_1620030 [Heliocybe sulcata]
MSESEYEGFDLTAEDFDEIDALALAALGPAHPASPTSPHSDDSSVYWDSSFGSISDFPGVADPSGPGILIELEDRPANVHALLTSIKEQDLVESDSAETSRSKLGHDAEPNSPFRKFRRKQILSVSDLVGPSWCEVQFDYGLRQRRWQKIETRPTTFVSAHGREIKVNTDIAVKNDKVLKGGQAVHKILERELKPVEFEVYVTTQEERWALRLINMLAAVESLMTLEVQREIPVFGIVHGQIVTGIIDELHREAKPQTPPPSAKKDLKSPYRKPALGKRLRHASDLREEKSLPRITSYFKSTYRERSKSPARLSTPERVPLPEYLLQLSDTKTRHTMTLPSDEDAISSRLQLMLYHRLLSCLLSQSSPFDFSEIWNQLQLRPEARLSNKFLADAGLMLGEGEGATMQCLNDFTAAWFAAVERLDVDYVDKHLKVMYRTRPPAEDDRPEDADEKLALSLSGVTDPDLQRAIEASLQREHESVAGPSGLGPEEGASEQPSLAWQVQNDLLKAAHEVQDTPPSPSSEDEPFVSHVFGVKYFEVDEALLDDHVKRTLEWWYGKRPPEGVSFYQTKRCFSCEYSDSCEWREARAQEALSKSAFGGGGYFSQEYF